MLHLMSVMGFALFAAITSSAAISEVDVAPAVGSNAGLEVFYDPVAGRIIDNPTDAQLGSMTKGVAIERRRSSWELRRFPLPANGWGVDLDGWADHSLVVEISADGTTRFVCSKGDDHSTRPTRNEDAER